MYQCPDFVSGILSKFSSTVYVISNTEQSGLCIAANDKRGVASILLHADSHSLLYQEPDQLLEGAYDIDKNSSLLKPSTESIAIAASKCVGLCRMWEETIHQFPKATHLHSDAVVMPGVVGLFSYKPSWGSSCSSEDFVYKLRQLPAHTSDARLQPIVVYYPRKVAGWSLMGILMPCSFVEGESNQSYFGTAEGCNVTLLP